MIVSTGVRNLNPSFQNEEALGSVREIAQVIFDEVIENQGLISRLKELQEEEQKAQQLHATRIRNFAQEQRDLEARVDTMLEGLRECEYFFSKKQRDFKEQSDQLLKALDAEIERLKQLSSALTQSVESGKKLAKENIEQAKRVVAAFSSQETASATHELNEINRKLAEIPMKLAIRERNWPQAQALLDRLNARYALIAQQVSVKKGNPKNAMKEFCEFSWK